MKITKAEVEDLIDLVEKSLSRELSSVSINIQSAKKMNGCDAQRIAVSKLLDLLHELVVMCVLGGTLPPKETITGYLKMYKSRHNPKA